MKKVLYIFGLIACTLILFTSAVNAQIITTFAGVGNPSISGDGGQATAAGLGSGLGVAVDASGNTYITSETASKIRKVSSTGIITTFAGTGVSGFFGDGGAASLARMSLPIAIATDAAGNIYFTDNGNIRIRKINTSGIISTIAGSGGSGSYTGDGGAATLATFSAGVQGLAVDGAGNVYVADVNNNVIRKINSSGIISTFAGNSAGTSGSTGDGGQATAAKLNTPEDVAVDASGNVYIADFGNNVIRKVTTTGIISTFAGNHTLGYIDGVAATAAELSGPSGVCVDASNNVYIADYNNNRVRKVNSLGIISTLAGGSTFGSTGDGGAATAGLLHFPTYVAIDASSNIYIADDGNYKIRRIVPPVASITGPTAICGLGDSINLHDATTGGTWSSASIGVATVSGTGGVYGISVGSAVISYTKTGVSATYTVTVNTIPTATITGTTPLCAGSVATLSITGTNNAMITLAPAGTGTLSLSGTGAGTYTVSPGATTTYSISTISISGCSTVGIGSAIVTFHALPTATLTATGSTTICAGSSAILSVTGTANAVIDLSSSATFTLSATGHGTVAVSPLANTTYSISTVSFNGCSQAGTGTIPIVVKTMPTATVSGSPTVCAGTATTLVVIGTANSVVTLSPIYTLTLNATGHGIPTVTPLATTVYTISSVSLNGCAEAGTGAATVTVNAIPTATISGTTSVCHGSVATLSITGTDNAVVTLAPAATLTLSGTGGGTHTVSPVATTTYSISLVSLSGCHQAGTGTATVTIKVIPTATISGTTSICAGTIATLTANGSPLSALTLSPSGTFSLDASGAGTHTVSPAATTTYSITTVSLTGCSQAGHGSAVITVNVIPTATITGTTTICDGSVATLSVNGTNRAVITLSPLATFTLSTTGYHAYTVNPSSPTTYSVTNVALNGCSSNGTSHAIVTVNAVPTATISVSGSSTICAGSVTTLSVTGTAHAVITLSPLATLTLSATGHGTHTVSPAANTTYSISSVSFTGCSQAGTGTAPIVVHNYPTATITGTPTICHGSSATLNITGTANAAVTLSPLATLTLSATGHGTATLTPATTTTYTISSVSLNNCAEAGAGSATVTVHIVPTATISGTAAICHGSVATLSITGTDNAIVTLSPAATLTLSASGLGTHTVSPTTTTTYSISLVSLSGCSQAGTRIATVTVNAIPTATISGTTSICAGSVATLSVSGSSDAAIILSPAGSFTLDGTGFGTHTVSPAGTTTYTITTVSLLGCSQAGHASAVITILAIPTATITGSTTICDGSPATLIITGTNHAAITLFPSGTLTLSATGHGTQVVSPSATTVYSISLVSFAGCSQHGTGIASVTVNAIPTATISVAGSSTICAGRVATLNFTGSHNAVVTLSPSGSLTLSATGHGTYTVSPPTNTTYSIASVMLLGCSQAGTGTANITVNAIPTATITGTTTICHGDATTLTIRGSNNATVTLSPYALLTLSPTGSDTYTVTPATNTTYTITLVSLLGCSQAGSGAADITVNPLPTGTITGTTAICEGDVATLTINGSDFAAVTLSPSGSITLSSSGHGVLAVTPTVTTTYTIANLSLLGCNNTGSRSAIITVNPLPSATITGTSAICIGSDATLTVTGTPHATIVLSPAGTGTLTLNAAGLTTFIVSPTVTTTYAVSSVISLLGCTHTGTGSAVITVNHVPVLTPVASQTVCNTDITTGIHFTSSISTATFDWVNSTPSIGLAATGSGDISSYIAVNTGSLTVVAVITVTPSSSGCIGASSTFSMTVRPTPNMAAIPNQIICNGDTTTTIHFTSTSPGATFNWTNSLPSVGLAASATGVLSIPSFTVVNDGSVIENAIINVTPLVGTCTGSVKVFSITVNPTPTITAVANQSVCNTAGTTAVIFNSSVSGSTFNWLNDNTTIGLSASGTSSNIPTFTAINSGTAPVYAVVSVTATANSCIGGTVTFTITVNATPTLTSVSSQTVCVNSMSTPVNFTGSFTGITYTWSNSNSTIGLASAGTGNIAAFTAINTSTTAAVALITVTPAANGCTGAPGTFRITVKPLLDRGTISGFTSVCASYTIGLTENQLGGIWRVSNGNASIVSTSTVTGTGSGTVTAMLTGNTAGKDTVYYIETNLCGSDSALYFITVRPLPDAGTISGASSLCQGDTTRLVDTFDHSAGTWSATNGHASLRGALVTGYSGGLDTIKYKVTNSCGSAYASATISVIPTPLPGAITGYSITCTGTNLLLTDDVSGGTWTVANSNATVSNGVVTGVNMGTDTVYYILTNVCGSKTVKKTISIQQPPHSSIAIFPNSMLCVNTMYQNFGADTAASAHTSYEWTATNAHIFLTSANKQNSLVNFTDSGNVIVTLSTYDSLSHCVSVAQYTNTVSPNIASTSYEVILYGADELIYLDAAATSYQWGYDNNKTLDSTALKGQVNMDYFATSFNFTNNDYWVMTVTGGCLQKTYYTIPSNVANTQSGNEAINIYPNPTNANLYIDISNFDKIKQLYYRIFDMTGKKLLEGKLSQNKESIDVMNLTNGVYSISFYNDSSIFGTKIFVKK